MNEELTLDGVRSVLGKFSFIRRILAWDSFKCHVMETVKQELQTSKIDPLIIPGGCTKYIQAPDVVWNKPFKANVTEKYDEWMAGEAHSFTAAGNMRAPPRREIVKWILAAWDGFGQKNDYRFIQELCANRCSGWIRGRTHSLLQGKSALPCRARTALGCPTSHEQFTRQRFFRRDHRIRR